MIDLPESPAPQGATVSFVDYGSTLTPTLGGTEQRINRLGSRFALNVALPPMKNKEKGRVWISRLIRGMSEGVRMPFPLSGIDPGSAADIGLPTIFLDGHTGRELRINNFTPGYKVKEGQFFSIETDGNHYLYQASEDQTVNPVGALYLEINPLLRVPHRHGDRCHFLKPMIEGFIEGDTWKWDYALDHYVEMQFKIKERR